MMLRRPALILAAVLALAACGPDRTVEPATPAATTDTPAVDATFPEETTAPTAAPTAERLAVGDVGRLSDGAGKELARVTVARVRFTRGDTYNRPERGWFMGAYVKVRATAGGQSSLWGDFYVAMRGHHYDADGCCPSGFTPTLDYVDLNAGETAEGWLVFDVPAQHGEVALSDSIGGAGKLAVWTF